MHLSHLESPTVTPATAALRGVRGQPARGNGGAIPIVATAALAVTLFLLTADLVYVRVGFAKIKYGYFAVVALWLFAPRAMAAELRAALATLPRWLWLPLAPLAVSVALSANVRDSVAWCLWLGFDLFTVATVYCFLRAQRLSRRAVTAGATWALALMAAFGLAQFVAIYVLQHPIFAPQFHFDVYRINGLSGWPHFFNIFAFLLLPIAMAQRPLSWVARVVLAVAMLVLVQSTAKTGWVLFACLGVLLVVLDRDAFRDNFVTLLVPVTVIALLLPTPSFRAEAPPVTATEKISAFSADLDLRAPTTSGTDRVRIAKMGLAVWWKHPWFGVGPRAYDEYVFTRFDQELPHVDKLDVNGNVNAKNENIWIEMLAENGALFTLAFLVVVMRALWVPRLVFANRLHMGAWIALVLYATVSGQVSQTGLLTLVYAVTGIYFYGRSLPPPGASREGQ